MGLRDLIPIESQIIKVEPEIEEVEPEETEPSAAELALNLTEKQRKAAENYLVCWDKNKAVADAYDATAESVYQISAKTFRNPKVVAYIAARTREKALPADLVLAKLAEIATMTIEDFLKDDMLDAGQAMFDLAKARELGVLHLVRRIRYLDKGGVELEFYDKMRALELIGKALNMFKETEINVDNYVIRVVREGE